MKERGWIEPIVERVVGQVLDSQCGATTHRDCPPGDGRDRCRTCRPPTMLLPSSSCGRPGARRRRNSVGPSQREILRALLDTSARYAARVALFVVKGSHATGWQARGFANSDGVKDFALDENAPAVVRAIGDRTAASVPVADLDARFLEEFGAPASGEGRILPLLLKDKVAALVYADSGTAAAGLLDAGSLELLVLSTSAWLEVNSLRKQAQKEPSAAHADSHHSDSHGGPAAETPSYPPAHTVAQFNDPFASHAPRLRHGGSSVSGRSPGVSRQPPQLRLQFR